MSTDSGKRTVNRKGRLLDQAQRLVENHIARGITFRPLASSFITVIAMLEIQRKEQKLTQADSDFFNEIYGDFPGLHQLMEQAVYSE